MAKVEIESELPREELVSNALAQAKKVLERCSTPNGFFASPKVYNAVYARDALISSLGGLVSGEEKFVTQWQKSMDTLMDRQSPSGQIPNCVDTFDTTRVRKVCFGAADASLWFVLTLAYAERLIGPFVEFHRAADRAMIWLEYQDPHEDGLIEQQEATDWMDIIANHGHVLYTNVLYFAALELRGDVKRAHLVREAINGFLWNRKAGYFRPWVWKQEHGDWFDTTANAFAIAFSLADEEQTDSILDYIKRNDLEKPFPVRVLHPPILPGDKDWREYYRTEHELNMPDQYHNGGIWPWVSGLYVAALVKAGRLEHARDVLAKVALLNRLGRRGEWEFNEWIHGVSGEPKGSGSQCWSAGMFLYAHTCVEQGLEPVFNVLESPETKMLHGAGA
jgi:glycogen debranching enzyme